MLNGQSIPDNILSKDWLFVMTANVGSDGPFMLYVTAFADGDIVSYGPCPVAAYSAFGANSPKERSECLSRLWYSSDVALLIKDGGLRPFTYTHKFEELPNASAFASSETAALASAAMGWPDPVVLYRKPMK